MLAPAFHCVFKQGTNSRLALCKLRRVCYHMLSGFVRFPKSCDANIFDFQFNVLQLDKMSCFLNNISLRENISLIYKSNTKTRSN